MKYFDWDPAKNELLKAQRGISFEDVVSAIEGGRLLKIINHPSQKKYPRQKIMVVSIDDYAYVVPYVEKEGGIFFKTVYPSRAATKLYVISNKRKL